MKTRDFPLGARVKLADLEVNPYPILRRLQEEEPVSWVPEFGAWFVTRRRDVMLLLSSLAKGTGTSPVKATFGPQMLSSDGEEHTRFRKPCDPLFHPRNVASNFVQAIRKDAESLIDAFADPGEAELRTSLASPLAIRSVMRIVGLPVEDTARMRAWYDEFALALANYGKNEAIRARGLDAAAQFRTYISTFIESRKSNPDGSLIAALLNAGALSDDEVASNALITLFGGIETTESMITNAAWALLRHPYQLAEIRANRELLPNAIEESLRWEPAVQSCTRFATRDTPYGDALISEGDMVQCMIGAANRDPEVFHDPDRFDIHRKNARENLSFGQGRHYCLGAYLARIETKLALECLLDRFPELSIDDIRTIPPRGYEFRKCPALWVKW